MLSEINQSQIDRCPVFSLRCRIYIKSTKHKKGDKRKQIEGVGTGQRYEEDRQIKVHMYVWREA